jgi:hypothetical protein
MRFKIRILFFIVYFILLIKTSEQELTSESRSNSALKVNVNRNLENDGFHRLVVFILFFFSIRSNTICLFMFINIGT